MIVELTHLGQARPPWWWFEIDLDQISSKDLLLEVPPEVAIRGPVRANAMTRQHFTWTAHPPREPICRRRSISSLTSASPW